MAETKVVDDVKYHVSPSFRERCALALLSAVACYSGAVTGSSPRRFPTHRAQEIIKSVLQERFQGVTYDHDKITDLSRAAADEIKLKIKGALPPCGCAVPVLTQRAAAAALELARYKIMVQILVGDQRGEGAVYVRRMHPVLCGVPHALLQPGMPLLLGQEHGQLCERDVSDGTRRRGARRRSRRRPPLPLTPLGRYRPWRRKTSLSPQPYLPCTTTERVGHGSLCDSALQVDPQPDRFSPGALLEAAATAAARRP